MTIKKPRRLIVDQPFPHSHKDSACLCQSGCMTAPILQHESRPLKMKNRHRRTGRGGEGGCSPPKFWATRENLGKARFKRRFVVFFLIAILKTNILYFILTKILTSVGVIIKLHSLETQVAQQVRSFSLLGKGITR